MTFNEFKRLLDKAEIPENMQIIFMSLYERFGEVLKQQELTGQCMVQFAEQLKGFVELREADSKRIQRIAKGQREEGVDVHSEAFDPNTRKDN